MSTELGLPGHCGAWTGMGHGFSGFFSSSILLSVFGSASEVFIALRGADRLESEGRLSLSKSGRLARRRKLEGNRSFGI